MRSPSPVGGSASRYQTLVAIARWVRFTPFGRPVVPPVYCSSATLSGSGSRSSSKPRSWDEYRDVLPLLGKRFQAIAMDTIGFGDSSKPPHGRDSIEHWAEVMSLMDALGIRKLSVVGHHTGAVIATEIAAAYPDRIEAAVLSASALVYEKFRARHTKPVRIDNAPRQPDGSHLAELWRIRQAYYHEGNIDLLKRFIVDALRAGPRAAEGHVVVARYVMETRLPLIRCPVLIIAPTPTPTPSPPPARSPSASPAPAMSRSRAAWCRSPTRCQSASRKW